MTSQVYAMPVYDMIEYQLVKRGVPNGFPTRLVYRTVYIIIVAFIGMTIPFFGQYLSAACPLLTEYTTLSDAQGLQLCCVPYLELQWGQILKLVVLILPKSTPGNLKHGLTV